MNTFWSEICYQLRMKRKLNINFHPQTDKQLKNKNKR